MSQYLLPSDARQVLDDINLRMPAGLARAGTTDLTYSWTARTGVTAWAYVLTDNGDIINKPKMGWVDSASYIYTADARAKYGQPGIGTLSMSIAEYDPVRKLYGPFAALRDDAAFNNTPPTMLTATLATNGGIFLAWTPGSVDPFNESFYLVKILKSDKTTVLSSVTVTEGPWYVYPLTQNETDNGGAAQDAIYFSVTQVDANGTAVSAPSPVYTGGVPVV